MYCPTLLREEPSFPLLPKMETLPWAHLNPPNDQRLREWPPEAVIFCLNGHGRSIIFLAPFEALSWAYMVAPGIRQLPATLWRAMEPFLEKTGRDIEPRNRSFRVSASSRIDDVALYLSGVCQSFKSMDEAKHYARRQGFILAQTHYEGRLRS